MHALYHHALLKNGQKNEKVFTQMNKTVSLEANIYSEIGDKGKVRQMQVKEWLYGPQLVT